MYSIPRLLTQLGNLLRQQRRCFPELRPSDRDPSHGVEQRVPPVRTPVPRAQTKGRNVSSVTRNRKEG